MLGHFRQFMPAYLKFGICIDVAWACGARALARSPTKSASRQRVRANKCPNLANFTDKSFENLNLSMSIYRYISGQQNRSGPDSVYTPCCQYQRRLQGTSVLHDEWTYTQQQTSVFDQWSLFMTVILWSRLCILTLCEQLSSAKPSTTQLFRLFI